MIPRTVFPSDKLELLSEVLVRKTIGSKFPCREEKGPRSLAEGHGPRIIHLNSSYQTAQRMRLRSEKDALIPRRGLVVPCSRVYIAKGERKGLCFPAMGSTPFSPNREGGRRPCWVASAIFGHTRRTKKAGRALGENRFKEDHVKSDRPREEGATYGHVRAEKGPASSLFAASASRWLPLLLPLVPVPKEQSSTLLRSLLVAFLYHLVLFSPFSVRSPPTEGAFIHARIPRMHCARPRTRVFHAMQSQDLGFVSLQDN